MLKQFDSLVFFVEDIHLAAKWYAGVLSNTTLDNQDPVNVEYENENYAYIRLASVSLGFHPKDEKSNEGSNSQTVYWRVEHLLEAKKTFESHGALLYRGPIISSLGEHACILQDPFLNTIGLISDKP